MNKQELELLIKESEGYLDDFLRLDFGEKIGSGLKRMENICKKENAPIPEIKIRENYFYITFKENKEYLKLANKTDNTNINYNPNSIETTMGLPSNYPETTLKILTLINENKTITREQLAEKTGLTIDGIKYHIKELTKKGILERIGPDKEGYWKVKK